MVLRPAFNSPPWGETCKGLSQAGNCKRGSSGAGFNFMFAVYRQTGFYKALTASLMDCKDWVGLRGSGMPNSKQTDQRQYVFFHKFLVVFLTLRYIQAQNIPVKNIIPKNLSKVKQVQCRYTYKIKMQRGCLWPES